ncbi:MAG TPA: LPS export ABC transporter periplasmic protein LptC [Terriglobales bacterium]|nr:LPS export ABC transporter periplasmic protein LptC [Terriglobales bacterium]
MALSVAILRRWFAIGAVLVIVIVGGTYYFAKWRIENALKRVPGKLNIEIQQSAQGFTISKSEGGRTLYKIQASKAIQYKEGGKATLHDVAITLYGRDSTRFDQIYGSDFEYDKQTGDVTAHGEVQIDLEANPEGLMHADQAVPKELKNPIHLKTSSLVFNQNTGDAHASGKVEFTIPQATGTAMGASYKSKESTLVLQSQVQIEFTGENHATVNADRATMTKTPQAIVLDHLHLHQPSQTLEADVATLYLRKDSTVEKIVARGNVKADSQGDSAAHLRSEQLEVLMTEQKDTVRTATFSGNVQMEASGDQPMQGNAGRIIVNFSGKNQPASVRAEDSVKLLQHQRPAAAQAEAQDLEITAPAMNFFFKAKHMERAETSGPPQIVLRPSNANSVLQQTVVTAGKFVANFDKKGLNSVRGAPSARIVTSTPGESDRISTSDMFEAIFRPGKGIESITQQDNFAYVDDDRKAWAKYARYTPADHLLTLTGSPRVVDGGMATTANSMKMNRASGDAIADGDVKSTYSDLKPQPNGALLASSSPIHVTAKSMTAHKSPSIAIYSGGARLWQDANAIEAPSIQFDRDHRSVIANAANGKLVSMLVNQTDNKNRVIPLAVNSTHLAYTDNERKAHFDGNVVAKWTDLTITSRTMDIFLQAHSETPSTSANGLGKLDRVVASDQVVINQPKRQGTGDQLVYTAADDKFVLTGGPPSIFDAEQGKITGVSLTLFRHDDRVLVEGNAASPVVTQTRVAR